MIKWKGKLDPSERIEFVADFARADPPVLEPGETIADYNLAVDAEGVSLGLTIETDPTYAPRLVSLDDNDNVIDGATAILMWLTIAPEMQASPEFQRGAWLGVVATIDTTSVPSRKRERTFLVEAIQQ